MVSGGWKIIRLDEATSTNDICADLAKQGAPSGTVVVARSQTKGRGRFARPWVSLKDKGSYFSVILDPLADTSDEPLIPLSAALSIIRAIHNGTGVTARLKWPNDVLIGGKKVSGVLVEKKNGKLIVGIGCNTGHEIVDFPPDIRDKSTSLRIETKKDVDKDNLMDLILDHLAGYLSKIDEKRGSSIISEAKKHMMTLGGDVRISLQDGIIEGKALDLDMSGALIIQLSDGRIEKMHSGDIIDGN